MTVELKSEGSTFLYDEGLNTVRFVFKKQMELHGGTVPSLRNAVIIYI